MATSAKALLARGRSNSEGQNPKDAARLEDIWQARQARRKEEPEAARQRRILDVLNTFGEARLPATVS